jgi:hypothetical protein
MVDFGRESLSSVSVKIDNNDFLDAVVINESLDRLRVFLSSP